MPRKTKPVLCAHGLTEMCFCIARRPPVYVRPHVEMKPTGERVPPWSCHCDVKPYRRHKSEIECLPQADVDAFKRRHQLTDEGHARALLFIESFAPRS